MGETDGLRGEDITCGGDRLVTIDPAFLSKPGLQNFLAFGWAQLGELKGPIAYFKLMRKARIESRDKPN